MAQKLTDLRVHEVSFVDRPANKGARALLWKRDQVEDGDYPSGIRKRKFTADERRQATSSGAAMPSGRYPIEDASDLSNAIRAVGRGNGSHAAIRQHIVSRARALGLTDKLPDSWGVKKADGSIDFDTVQENREAAEEGQQVLSEIREAVCSLGIAIDEISEDDEIADKQAAIAESIDQFKEHIQGVVPEGVENAMAAQALLEAGFELTDGGAIQKKGVEAMPNPVKKALGLPETATDAQVETALGELAKRAARADSILKMSAEHTAYMGADGSTMPSGGKEAFTDMSPAERDAHITKNPVKKVDDETYTTTAGQVISKREAGSMFTVIKNQDEQIRKSNERVEKAEDDRQRDQVVKRVSTLKFVPGTPEEVGTMIHSIAKRDPKLGEGVEALLKQLVGIIEKGAAFSEIGSGRQAVGKAFDAINAKAQEIRKSKPALSIEQARVEARKQNPDLAQQEADENKASRRAA